MQALQTLAPVFLVIGLGAALRRIRFLTPEFASGMNRLSYWVGLPCLLFLATSRERLDPRLIGSLGLVFLGVTLACLVLGALAARLLRLPGASSAALVQASFRGNLAFVGLPILFYAGLDERLAAQAAFLLAGAVIAFNILSVTVLLLGQGGGLRPSALPRIALRLVTNPLILACLAGTALSLLRLELPTLLRRSLDPLGQMALPLALLSVGASLDLARMRARFAAVGAAALIKVAAAPLLGLGLITLLGGFDPGRRLLLLVMLACPTAVSSYVMADQMQADSSLAAGAIALSTLLSILSLSVILALA